jgi:hypothetical protein
MVTILDRPAASNNWASGEYARGVRNYKVGAILHWMAGYLPGTTAMFQNPATGYATSLGVGTRDGRGNGLEVHRYVPSDGRAYGSANSYADGLCESIEIENNYWQGYASKPTPEVHEHVAQLLAQLAIEQKWRIDGKIALVLGDFPDHRYVVEPIPVHGVDFNVTTHRSMAWKDCPGSTDVQWIVARGNDLIRARLGSTPAGGEQAPIIIEEEDDMAIKFGHRKSGGDEWMIVHQDLRGADEIQRGYLVTTDRSEATAWGRTYAKGSNDYDFDVIREEYIDIQEAARRAYDAKTRAEHERRA